MSAMWLGLMISNVQMCANCHCQACRSQNVSGQIEYLRLPHNMLEFGIPHLPVHHCHHILSHFHFSLLTEGLYNVEELC